MIFRTSRVRNFLIGVIALGLMGCNDGPVQHRGTGITPSLSEERPNILLIVADDLGYTDIAPFGGEIATPNIDALAQNGITLTNFYASLSCSPTRAMLLTGMDNHQVGLGNMAETLADNQLGQPGYEGHLNDRALTLAEQLKDSGYHTYMAGKWHLGGRHELSARARGFERSFSLLYGGGSHFDDAAGPDLHRPKALYRDDGELINALPKDFYSSRYYTDKLLEYIDGNLADGKPFFGYLAYTAPHWPLQVPDDYRDKYRGRYDVGYDVLRAQRFQTLKEKGLIDAEAKMPARPASLPPWDELSDAEKKSHARNMEIYAAMVDYMDMSIGRVMDYLKAKGLYENTLVLFMSDNGADHWALGNAPKAIEDFARTFDQSVEMRGRKGSFTFYGAEWAHVSEAPFRLYKGYTAEGGVRVPAILSWPSRSQSANTVHARATVTDVLPTFLQAAASQRPSEYYTGKGKLVPQGRSMLPLLTGRAQSIHNEQGTFGLEMWGHRALYKGDWKLLYVNKPKEPGHWQLFNLRQDPAEQYDLAQAEPAKFSELRKAWDQYVLENNVLLPQGGFKIRPPSEAPSR